MAIPPIVGPAGATDEQSKAIAALANLGTTAVTEGSNLARYIGRIVGTVPEDAVGLVLGDPLHALRTIAAEWLDAKIKEIHERRRVTQTQPVSLSVAIPLMRGAYDETREGLRDLWAALIAAAMDPERAKLVRISFIDTLKQFDPLDAVVLRTRYEIAADMRPSPADFIAGRLSVSAEEIILSFDNLRRLNCIDFINNTITNVQITTYGRGLLRACSE